MCFLPFARPACGDAVPIFLNIELRGPDSVVFVATVIMAYVELPETPMFVGQLTPLLDFHHSLSFGGADLALTLPAQNVFHS